MRAVLRPMYQLNKDLRDFHLNIKEVHYIYNNVIDKRCFNSNIDQNTLNDRNHFNKVMKIIIENFILGNQVEIKKKINCLSKQEVYNILQYLEVFIFRSYLEPVKILSKRLKELSIRVDVKYFVNCIVTNFMESRHEGLTTDINFFLRDLQDKLENYEKFKLLNKRSKLVDILNPLLKDFNAKRKESLEIFNLLDPFLEVGKDLTDRGRELLDLFTKITGELNEMEDIIDKYMPSYDEINEQLARIEKENKKDNEDAE
jgi:hypothetical protein